MICTVGWNTSDGQIMCRSFTFDDLDLRADRSDISIPELYDVAHVAGGEPSA